MSRWRSLFRVSEAFHRDGWFLLKEVLLNPSFRGRGKVLWQSTFFVVLWGIGEEHWFFFFMEIEKSDEEIWEIIRFRTSLWVLVIRSVCNYSIGFVLLDLNPLSLGGWSWILDGVGLNLPRIYRNSFVTYYKIKEIKFKRHKDAFLDVYIKIIVWNQCFLEPNANKGAMALWSLRRSFHFHGIVLISERSYAQNARIKCCSDTTWCIQAGEISY